jgi:putative tryptophan/tyrosine transport system substrate-binding protein
MKRRKFITLFGGAAAIWPLASRAQQTGSGWRSQSPISGPDGDDPYRWISSSLSDLQYVVGQNVAIEYRWAEGY